MPNECADEQNDQRDGQKEIDYEVGVEPDPVGREGQKDHGPVGREAVQGYVDEKTGRKAQPEGLYPQSVNGRLPAQGPGYESKEKGREGDQGQGMRYASVQIEKEGGCRGKENINVRQTGREHAEKGKPGSSWLSWQDLRDKEA